MHDKGNAWLRVQQCLMLRVQISRSLDIFLAKLDLPGRNYKSSNWASPIMLTLGLPASPTFRVFLKAGTVTNYRTRIAKTDRTTRLLTQSVFRCACHSQTVTTMLLHTQIGLDNKPDILVAVAGLAPARQRSVMFCCFTKINGKNKTHWVTIIGSAPQKIPSQLCVCALLFVDPDLPVILRPNGSISIIPVVAVGCLLRGFSTLLQLLPVLLTSLCTGLILADGGSNTDCGPTHSWLRYLIASIVAR